MFASAYKERALCCAGFTMLKIYIVFTIHSTKFMLTPSSALTLFRLFLHPVYTRFYPLSSAFFIFPKLFSPTAFCCAASAPKQRLNCAAPPRNRVYILFYLYDIIKLDEYITPPRCRSTEYRPPLKNAVQLYDKI